MKENHKKIRNDLILVSVILVLAVVCFVIFRVNLKAGKTVNVSVNGEIIHSLSLEKDTQKIIETENGKNVIVISGGAAAVSVADCPDKICVEHRAISKVGETVVCLPHKLVLEIAEED